MLVCLAVDTNAQEILESRLPMAHLPLALSSEEAAKTIGDVVHGNAANLE